MVGGDKTLRHGHLMTRVIYLGQMPTDLREELSPAAKLLCELDLATEPLCVSVPPLKAGRVRITMPGLGRSGGKSPRRALAREARTDPVAVSPALAADSGSARLRRSRRSAALPAFWRGPLLALSVRLPGEGHTGKHPDYIALLAREWESVLNLLWRNKHMRN